MSQKRINNYGDFVNSLDPNEARMATLPKGRYVGFDLGVNTDGNITLGTGYGMQHNGIVWHEDSVLVLSAPASIPSGTASEHTIVASHTNERIIGGYAVTYEIVSGISNDSVFSDGVVLGWIYYPGGAVPLDASHLVSAPSQRNNLDASISTTIGATPTVMKAPFVEAYNDYAGLSGDVYFNGIEVTNLVATPRVAPPLYDLASFVVHQSVAKPSPAVSGPEALEQRFTFRMGTMRPYAIEFRHDISPVTTLQVELRGTDNVVVSPTPSNIVGAGAGWTTETIQIDRLAGTFVEGEPYQLRLTNTVEVDQFIKLAWIRILFWPYP